MIKKIIFAILTILPGIVQAQVAVGGWTLHSPFMGVDEISETDTYVYYKSGGALYRIDKETIEVTPMNNSNYLNDNNITGVFDDKNKKSVIVAYESGNMDRLYDDGSIVNIPDIKDAVISGSRKINDISFGKENFYVAADFGLVTYSDKKNEVKESMFTQNPVTFVATPGDLVVMHHDKRMHFGRQSSKLTSLDKIPPFESYTRVNDPTDVMGFGDNGVLVLAYDQLYTLDIDMENQKATEKWIRSAKNPGQNVSGLYGKLLSIKGKAYGVNKEGVYEFSVPGEYSAFIEIPRQDAPTAPFSYIGDVASVWIGDESGIKQVDYTDSSAPAVINSGIKGSDLTVPAIHAMHVGTSGKIYLYNLGEHQTIDIKFKNPSKSYVNVLSDGTLHDISGIDVQVENKNSKVNVTPGYVNANYRVYEDLTDNDAYYIGSFFDGLYRIKDGKQTHKYYESNSPMSGDGWSFIVVSHLVDKFGNLWVYNILPKKGDNYPRFFVLPSEKRLSSEIKVSDWKSHAINYWVEDNRDSYGILCDNSDYILFSNGRRSKEIVIFDTKGTENLNDDTYQYVNTYVDQDGKELTFHHIVFLCEDKKGRIWVGTDDGVFEIADLSRVNSTTAYVNHLKVPRNDGTNLADYLLSSQVVSSIAVDPSNRKWISTIGSGVYLVSENGDEILEHFTEANSILPNIVYAVACDPNSNKVYFGTAIGLIEYNSTSAPGSDSYDNVYAYPNPVRPDFTGWITVTGLMENSLVKIADAAGNVFHQGRSDGGMFTWDGCNAAGERVKTGVYYVYASQNATGDASACVTKIMVVN